MRRRTAAILALAVALLVAGCAGATGDAPPGTDGSAGPSGAATPSPTPAGPVYDLPLSGAAVQSAHDEALRSAGSFTVDTNVTVVDASSGEEFAVVTTAAVDLERGTMLLRGTSGGLEGQTVYVGPDGTAYQRVETASGDVRYERLADAPAVEQHFAIPVETLVAEATFAYAGRDRVAGTPVSVYEVTELEELVPPGQVSEVPDASVSAFEVRMAVSDDRVIRQFDYRVEVEMDGASQTIAMHIVFRDVGTTAVEPPDWLDEAA